MHGGLWFFPFLFNSKRQPDAHPKASTIQVGCIKYLLCPNDIKQIKIERIISHLVELLPVDGERERGLFFCVL
jgi:hypothetical protein